MTATLTQWSSMPLQHMDTNFWSSFKSTALFEILENFTFFNILNWSFDLGLGSRSSSFVWLRRSWHMYSIVLLTGTGQVLYLRYLWTFNFSKLKKIDSVGQNHLHYSSNSTLLHVKLLCIITFWSSFIIQLKIKTIVSNILSMFKCVSQTGPNARGLFIH